MPALQRHHIVGLFVWVDDNLPRPSPSSRGGRPPALKTSELLTILLWDGLNEPHKTLKYTYNWVTRDYHDCFHLPSYKSFVLHAHRSLPALVWLLRSLLRYDAGLRFADSTMLPVCKNIRVGRHKVAKGVAAWGKNWQGWHYGFKLHAGIDGNNRLAGICFTPADVYDAQAIEPLARGATKIPVGDTRYGASRMRDKLWRKWGIVVIAPPRCKQKRQLLTPFQHLLLTMRPKIEAAFDCLKEHMHLVSSFPRSVRGYLVHCLRFLPGYQMRKVS